MSTVSLRIKVERPDKFKAGQFKTLFRQELVYDSSVVIPFSKLYDGLRLLFPYEDSIVSFSVVNN